MPANKLDRATIVEQNKQLMQSLVTRMHETYGKPAPVAARQIVDDQLNAVIWDMERDTIIDVLDNTIGFGCYDDYDEDRMRDELTRQFTSGMVTREEIMEYSDMEDAAPAPGM